MANFDIVDVGDKKAIIFPRSIQKGVALKDLIGADLVSVISHNININHSPFDVKKFQKDALKFNTDCGLLDRASVVALAIKNNLPLDLYLVARIIKNSLGTELLGTSEFGLTPFQYLPYVMFVKNHVLDDYNYADSYAIGMDLNCELTKRFSAEYSIRPYVLRYPEETLNILKKWMLSDNPHLRRLCSEGTRPKLPWGLGLPNMAISSLPTIEILEYLKNDSDLYVRRSVANHMADLAKYEKDKIFTILDGWVKLNNSNINWIVRHAVRYYAKKNDIAAISLRLAAKK